MDAYKKRTPNHVPYAHDTNSTVQGYDGFFWIVSMELIKKPLNWL